MQLLVGYYNSIIYITKISELLLRDKRKKKL